MKPRSTARGTSGALLRGSIALPPCACRRHRVLKTFVASAYLNYIRYTATPRRHTFYFSVLVFLLRLSILWRYTSITFACLVFFPNFDTLNETRSQDEVL